MDHVIYYFSGTGNSKAVVHWLSEHFQDCTVRSLSNLAEKDFDECIDGKVGIICPLYYYGMPKIVRNFLNEKNFSSNAYIYSIITAEVGNGRAIEQMKQILMKKGATLSAAWYMPMPTNFIPTRVPPSLERSQKLYNNAKKKTKKIAQMIGKEISYNQRESPIFNMLLNTKNSYRNWISDENSKDQYLKINDQCIKCGICVRKCPVHNITLENSKISFQGRCEMCLSCINLCPKDALDYIENKKWNSYGKKRYRYQDKLKI